MQKRRRKDADRHRLGHPETRRAQFAHQPARCAHVHEPGGEKALQPARALPHPVRQPRVRFFMGEAVERARHVAMAREAEAQFGILRHVEGVPCAHLPEHRRAKVVGRAAQRQRQPVVCQHGQKKAEEHGIFGGELPGEPVLVGIEEGELRLEAGEFRARLRKPGGRSLELAGLRNILGVIDGEKFTAAERQGIVQCAGLGLRLSRRNHDDLDVVRQRQRSHRRLHADVLLLEDQLDVEFARRIAQPREGRHELLQDGRLTEQRHQHGIVWKRAAAHRAGLGRRLTRHRRHEAEQAQRDNREEEQTAHGGGREPEGTRWQE